MLRIIGAQRSGEVATEFVLLQNQCALKTALRGHVIILESAMHVGELCGPAHLFADDESIPSGAYVLLSTCAGTPHWSRSKDGSLLYRAFMNRQAAVWDGLSPLHLLAPQHTFVERREVLVLV